MDIQSVYQNIVKAQCFEKFSAMTKEKQNDTFTKVALIALCAGLLAKTHKNTCAVACGIGSFLYYTNTHNYYYSMSKNMIKHFTVLTLQTTQNLVSKAKLSYQNFRSAH